MSGRSSLGVSMASLEHGKPWTRGGSDGGTEPRQRWLEEPENPRGDTRVSAEAPTRGCLGGLEGSGSRPRGSRASRQSVVQERVTEESSEADRGVREGL